jgi:hypothetical protein
MPTFEEMVAWSIDEIKAHISEQLPSNWTVEHGTTSQSYTCTVKDEKGAVVKTGAQPDLRVLLLDIYGWLYTRGVSTRAPTIWSRRQGSSLHPVGGKRSVPGVSNIPDPDDLDPEAIRDLVEKKSKSN